MADSELNILVKIKNDAEAGIRRLQDQVGGVGKEFLNTKNAIDMASSALATYAGSRMLGSFINETIQANQTMAQAQFYANALGTSMSKNLMPSIIETGKEMQGLYGISDELASKAYAKMIAKFGNTGQTLDNLNTLVKLHKLGLWDIDSSTTMLMGSTDDMTRALQFMARSLAIEVNPKMDDFEEIMKRIQERLSGIDLSPLGTQIDIFKEQFGDMMEAAGTPFLETINWILGGVNLAIQRFPILGNVIAGTMAVIGTALAAAGFMAFLSTLGVVSAAIGPWVAVIAGGIAAVIFLVNQLNKIWTDHQETIMIVAGFVLSTLSALALFLASPIAIIVGLISMIIVAGLSVINNWETIKTSLSNIWTSLVEFSKNVWTGLKDWFEENIIKWFTDKIQWVQEQVSKIQSFVSQALSSISKVSSGIGQGVSKTVSGLLGSRAVGGPINETGPYLLHRGEYVVPSSRAGAGSNGITVNLYGNTFMGDEQGAIEIGNIIAKVLGRNIKF